MELYVKGVLWVYCFSQIFYSLIDPDEFCVMNNNAGENKMPL